MYEYLASVQSAVRRFNERAKTLAKNFGENSAVMNKIKVSVDVFFKDNLRYKDGVPQIFKPSDIYGDDEKMKALQYLDEHLKTWGDYRRQYENEYTGYIEEGQDILKYKDTSDKLGFSDFIQTMENIDKALRETPSEDMPERALAIMKKTGARKTYKELFYVYNILKEKGFA